MILGGNTPKSPPLPQILIWGRFLYFYLYKNKDKKRGGKGGDRHPFSTPLVSSRGVPSSLRVLCQAGPLPLFIFIFTFVRPFPPPPIPWGGGDRHPILASQSGPLFFLKNNTRRVLFLSRCPLLIIA